MRLLVTRAAIDAEETAARLRGLGHDVMTAPLLDMTALPWIAPDRLPQAVLMTSAWAARLAGPAAAALYDLPLFAVGARTADAARAAGFGDVRVPDGVTDAESLIAAVVRQGHDALLHLGGRDRIAPAPPAGVTVDTRDVYAARLCTAIPDDVMTALTAGSIDMALLYSPRSASHFARLYDAGGFDRAAIALACLSEAIAAAAGGGWRSVAVADRPREDALFAVAGLACHSGASPEQEETDPHGRQQRAKP